MVGRRIRLSRIGYVLVIFWVTSRVRVGLKAILLESSNCVFSVFPLDRFAVTDPDTSRSLTNSVAASVFPSGNCHENNV